MNIAIIPARAGSKRIKNKNIINFFGKPLIYYCIKAALESKIFDDVIVSTDSSKIQKIAKKYGASVYFKRPKIISGDMSGTPEVISHSIKWLQKNLYKPKYVCCIYPTAIFLNKKNLVSAFKKIKTDKFNFVFTVNRYSHPPQRGFNLIKNNQVNFKNNKYYKSRTQDLTTMYHDAGQFYWGKSIAWIEQRKIFEKNSSVEIVPNIKSVDIDNLEDLDIAKRIFLINKKNKLK